MNTNIKGDIALAETILNLTKLGYDVYTPISDHPKADLIATKNSTVYKIQCKYLSKNIIRNYSKCNKKTIYYTKEDFDIYAIYISSIDKVIYVPFELGGISIQTEIKMSNAKFWWYEDFLNIDNVKHEKRSVSDFGIVLKNKINKKARNKWPTKEELQELINAKPMYLIAKDLNVSDVTIKKWCKAYDIITKKRGFWLKENKQI